ncbi:MAG: N-acetylmuramoyl-L-alanine amidase [Desulfohalobiaceae bacterium]|nr:N-acetylmuramoyl-L-alanine amidase [Desulfohalobiaceae bacterium]
MPYLRPFFCLMLLAAFCGAALPAAASSPASAFQQGWNRFHELRKDQEKGKYRSHWLEVKRYFKQAYRQDTDGPFAPKSLYYLGRTYQELGKRSYLAKDYRQAITYFQKQLRRFPEHGWSDDAKLYIAKIRLNHLQKRDQAYLDLLSVLHDYPDGDMTDEAKDLLRRMDKEYVEREESPPERKEGSEERPRDSSKLTLREMSKLQDIRHWSSEEYTRVVLDLEEQTQYNDFLLKQNPKQNKPYRLVIDLTKSWIPKNLNSPLQINDGLLQRVRASQFRKSISRVVLDVQDLKDYRVFSLQNPYRVVVDVYASEPEGKKSRKQAAKLPLELKEEDVRSDLVKQLGLGVETVMIDPGHGGKMPGAVVKGILEKDINLRMGKILGKTLEEKGFRVLYTRKKDQHIPLEERTALANSKDVDLFISLHCNAHDNHRVRGLEIYNLNLATSEDAAEVAARENSVSQKKISDLELILTDLMLKSKIRESSNLGRDVLQETVQYGEQFYNLKRCETRQAPFYVLMGAKMPAILVELGYLSNPTERKRLQNYAYLKRLAWGITQGILAYKEEISQQARRR